MCGTWRFPREALSDPSRSVPIPCPLGMSLIFHGGGEAVLLQAISPLPHRFGQPVSLITVVFMLLCRWTSSCYWRHLDRKFWEKLWKLNCC